MINHTEYTGKLTVLLKKSFGERLLYVGLQGSYLRGEATEKSDIDIMTVIDRLTVGDLEKYRADIESLGDADRSCGFICGGDELANWNPLEICQLLHTTRDIYGRLSGIVPEYTREDERNYIKMSLNNLYHELCHRFVHSDRAKTAACLPGMNKPVFFILQNLYYLRHGVFAVTRQELSCLLTGADLEIYRLTEEVRNGSACDFDAAFTALFNWCRDTSASV